MIMAFAVIKVGRKSVNENGLRLGMADKKPHGARRGSKFKEFFLY